MTEHTLILLRHAKSDWSGGESDMLRPLAKRGRRQAPDAGRWLAANIDRIDVAVVSPARRARETWELVGAELGASPRTRIVDQAYAASGHDLLSIVRRLSDDIDTAILIGHNPGIVDLTSLLTRETLRMPTSALAVITIDRAWSRAAPYSAALLAWGRPPAD